jgi:RNA polymerase sigma-70 factor, ECF subfamily
MRSLAPSRPPTPESPMAASVPDEDAWLVASAKTDPSAFAPLYARYFDPVYRYCYRRLGSPDAAADACAQVFTKAIAALPGYREGRTTFRSWLFAIAHNVLIDEMRTRKPTTVLEAALTIADAAATPEEAALSAEATQTIVELLGHLPPDQRRVMELRLAGLTGPEIAAALDRTLGGVKIAQVRAIARLRIALGVTTPSNDSSNDSREESRDARD